MKIFDKAQWHIDEGEKTADVLKKFQCVFDFLEIHNMLNTNGKEIYTFGIDSSISLNENMLTKSGVQFLEKYYDTVINCTPDTIGDALKKQYQMYTE